MLHDHQDQPPRHNWVFLGFIAVAAFFLLTEHTAHVLGVLPYLLLAACPLMHLFMHHGHRHGGHRRPADEQQSHDDDSKGGEA